jgi:D-tyrosyl-tRNA(Tyr) deacylase
MRAVVQRVRSCRVVVAGETVGEIGPGLLVLLGVRTGDGPDQVRWLADKIVNLRILEDAQGKMNFSVADAGGSILVVSQFTLYGDCQKGRRPSFIDAARPEVAEPLYDSFINAIKLQGVPVATGRFAADMQVELVNDGPVTLVIDTVEPTSSAAH